jgi:uncharacterized protein YbaP (TraB family)
MLNSLTEDEIKSRGIPVLDLYLAQEASRLQKQIGAVERVEEQCQPLNDMDLAQVMVVHYKTLSEVACFPDQFCGLAFAQPASQKTGTKSCPHLCS